MRNSSKSSTRLDTVVVGAGMAGLTAARTLAEAGVRVAVVEARNRIGGRILTHRSGGNTLELGAEFIHGRSPELWALIAETGLDTYERKGSPACFEDGLLRRCNPGNTPSVFLKASRILHLLTSASPNISPRSRSATPSVLSFSVSSKASTQPTPARSAPPHSVRNRRLKTRKKAIMRFI